MGYLTYHYCLSQSTSMYRISLSFACSIRNDMRQTANKVLVVGSERFVEEVDDLQEKF